MLFPESSTVQGHPANHMPVFLSGEKRQAIRTSTYIPPVEAVEKVKENCNQVRLQDYMWVTSSS